MVDSTGKQKLSEQSSASFAMAADGSSRRNQDQEKVLKIDGESTMHLT